MAAGKTLLYMVKRSIYDFNISFENRSIKKNVKPSLRTKILRYATQTRITLINFLDLKSGYGRG